MRKKAASFVIGGLTAILFLTFTWDVVFKYFGVLTKLNYIVYDAGLKIFHDKSRSDTVVIVDIDEKSLKYEGRWPWSRAKVAKVVEILQASGAAVIVFDVFFPEQESNVADILIKYAEQNKNASRKIIGYLSQQLPYFDHDKMLAATLAQGDVVLGEFFSDDLYHSSGKLGKPLVNLTKPENLVLLQQSKFIGNVPILVNAVRYAGFTTILPDEDGVLRRSPLLIEYNKELYPALALEAARAYLLTDKVSLDLRDLGTEKVFLGVQLGDIYIPTDLAGRALINYCGAGFSFPFIAATDVISHNFSPQTFSGKVVLIGSSAAGIGDLHSTPLQAAAYPGVEVHASIISSILKKNMLSSPIWLVGIERILIVTISLFFAILAAYFSVSGLLVSTLLLMILIFAVNTLLLVKWCWVLPHLMLPYLQVLFLGVINSGYGYLFEMRYRKKLHEVYGQYVSSVHIDQMLEVPDRQNSLDGDTKVMTVLFSDIRGFTSISEKLDAKEVKRFLNTLFTPLTEVIFEHKGTIDKYVGDMIVAFWNDPIADSEHALHGVQAALMMQDKVRELAPVFAGLNLANVGIRIGVNTGRMQVGDMGSKYRKAYTVLGDAVNLGSRLEGVNKMYGTNILVSQTTKDLCSGVVFRFIDCVYVKGKDAPTSIYEPLCLLSSGSGASYNAELAQYDEALELYNTGKWGEAKDGFARLAVQYPRVEIYAIYLKRVTQYEMSPPPPDWDRGQHLTEK